MRVAVISDIHANMYALEKVLADIEKEGCEKIICLGDLLLAGPQPEKIIEFVPEQDWIFVQGNTDKLIAEYSPEVVETLREKFPVMANALADDINYTDEEFRSCLQNLMPQIEFEIDGVKILLVHGSPRANNEDILPDRPPEEIEEIISGTDADLILCGHTHIPCGYQTNSRQTVVNVGSVGRPMTRTPMACYAVLDVNDGVFSLKHKFVDYEREKAAEAMRARVFEGADKLAELLINPAVRHI